MIEKQLKVGIIVPSMAKQGPVIVARNLAVGLLEKGINVSFYYLNDNSKNKISLPSELKVKKLNFSNFLTLLECNIIHSNSLIPDLITSFLFLFYHKKIQFFTTIHNIIFSDVHLQYSKNKALLIKLLWPITWIFKHKCVVLTRVAQNEYVNKLPFIKNKITYCYNGIDSTLTGESTDVDSDAINAIKRKKEQGFKIIGTCAVLTKVKGIEHVITAMKYTEDNVIFVIVGNGCYKNKLIELTNKEKLQHRILFFDRTDVPLEYMRTFDVFVMPSLSEGFGLVVVEAAFCGCNIVLSNIETFKELFSNTDFISFTTPNEPLMFADAIRRQLKMQKTTNNKLRNDLIEKFSYRAMTSKYLLIYLDNNKFNKG